MAFLDETGLSTFKTKCDSYYVRLNGGSSTQIISAYSYPIGLKTTRTALMSQNRSATIYGPGVEMYDKNDVACGKIVHGFEKGANAPSSLGFYAQNKMSDGTELSGGLIVYRNYNIKSDTEGTTYWFSSKPNVRTAIGIFSGTTAPTTDTSRANGDIYIQY